MYTSFFMDTENLNTDILKELKFLDKSDKVYFFYSVNSKKITFDVLKDIVNINCKIQFIESTMIGPNALDFELVSFVGSKIGGYKKTNNKHKYVILSNDTGFDATIAYWKSKNINISRSNNFGFIIEEMIRDKTNNYGLDEESFYTVMKLMKKCGTKQKLHTLLQNSDNMKIKTNYLEIYKSLRKDFNVLKEEAKKF